MFILDLKLIQGCIFKITASVQWRKKKMLTFKQICFQLWWCHALDSKDHMKVWTANLLHPIQVPSPQAHKQPSQLPMAKGNCLRYCHRRENHQQQIFAADHLFAIRYEPFPILLNKIFSFIQMFTLLKKHSSPDYFTWSTSFPFILDFNTLRWSDRYCRF